MDRVAGRLVEYLRRDHANAIEVTEVVPRFVRRATRLFPNDAGRAYTIDRIVNRLWDYPRYVERLARDHDVFHIVDHSYAQLVHRLPAGRTVVPATISTRSDRCCILTTNRGRRPITR